MARHSAAATAAVSLATRPGGRQARYLGWPILSLEIAERLVCHPRSGSLPTEEEVPPTLGETIRAERDTRAAVDNTLTAAMADESAVDPAAVAGPVFEDKEKQLDFANYFCSYGALTRSGGALRTHLRSPTLKSTTALPTQAICTIRRTC